MSLEVKCRKIDDLRVVDLRAELEKRGLDKTGVKAVLTERLKSALEEDGHDPDQYEFESLAGTPTTPQSKQNQKALDKDGDEEMANQVNGDTDSRKEEEEDEEEGCEEAADSVIDNGHKMNQHSTVKGSDEPNNGETTTGDKEIPEKKVSSEKDVPAEGENGKDEDDRGDEGKDEEGKQLGDVQDWGGQAEENHHLEDELEEEDLEEDPEEVAQTEEDDTRNIEDDSISLMLEDEEKMLEDEIAFTEHERIDQDEAMADGKERSRGKVTGSTTAAAATPGKKDSSHNDTQDKKECDKPKSSGEDKGKDDKGKDNRDHKTKSSSGGGSSSSSSGKNLWVSGLASSTRAQDLKSVFSKYGRVTSAKIVTNAKTPGAKCYGFVTMMSSDDAAKCISQLNHTELHGRMIQVEKAKGEPGGSTRNKPSSSIFPRKSDSKKNSITDKKKEGEKKDIDKKEAIGDKKDGSLESKGGKEGEKKRSHSKDPVRTGKEQERRVQRRTVERRSEHRGNAEPYNKSGGGGVGAGAGVGGAGAHQRPGRDVLSFKQIMEERERQRMRVRERIMREEERRRREDEVRQRNIERRQREEAERLQREREKLRIEREKIERQKHELLRLEREHQRMEREKLEQEREELRRQQMRAASTHRYEETRRSIKRPADDRDRREFFEDRKRPAPENRSRFESGPLQQRRGINDAVPRRYNEERNYDREPSRFDHNHGSHVGSGGSGSGGREDLRGGPSGGVSGSGSRNEERREVREREERRPIERSSLRDDRDHRSGIIASQTSRDRPRERYSGSGGDSWRTGGVSESKGNFGGSSSLVGSNIGSSGMTGRGGDSQGWRTSGSGDRWGSSSVGPGMGGRGSSSGNNLGPIGMTDFMRTHFSHTPQSNISPMSMPMMSQNDRFQTSSFRKYQ